MIFCSPGFPCRLHIFFLFLLNLYVQKQQIGEAVVEEPVERGSQVVAPSLVVDDTDIVRVQDEKQIVTKHDFIKSENVETCADGAMPDINGCCAGEEYAVQDDGTYVCCIIGTDECFDPLM